NVPSPSAKVRGKYAPSGEAAGQSRQATGQHMLLMAMHHVGVANGGEDCAGDRIEAVSSNIPGMAGNADTQLARLLFMVLVAKGQQLRGRLLRHVPRQFIDITLG